MISFKGLLFSIRMVGEKVQMRMVLMTERIQGGGAVGQCNCWFLVSFIVQKKLWMDHTLFLLNIQSNINETKSKTKYICNNFHIYYIYSSQVSSRRKVVLTSSNSRSLFICSRLLTCKPTSSDYQEIIYRVWTITKKIKALINNYATKFELFINHYNIYCWPFSCRYQSVFWSRGTVK